MTTLRAALKRWGLIALLPFIFGACQPKQVENLLQPAEALGVILAQETVKIAGAGKQVVLITPDANWGPASTAETAFRAELKKQGVVIAGSLPVSLGDPMKSGTVGLKSADFLAALEKFPDAAAIVSFAGGPLLSSDDVARLPKHYPPVFVVAVATLGAVPGVPGKGDFVAGLVEEKVIQFAIVDGAGEAAATPGKTDSTRQLFAQHFQILRASDVHSP